MYMHLLTAILVLTPSGSQAAPMTPLSPPSERPVIAQAEVSASKSPVKLTLSIYKTTLKLQDSFKLITDFERLDKEHPRKANVHAQDGLDLEKYTRRVPIKVGEPLWIKIRLTNIGRHPIFIMDDLFTGPKDFHQAIEDKLRYYGVKLRITAPNGKEVPLTDSRELSAISCPENKATFDPVGTAKAAAWRKEGKTTNQINALLERDLRAEEARTREWAKSHHPIKKLEPGETASTSPWRYQGKCRGQGASYPAQVGDYSQLWGYHLDTPGVYKISAVYFDDPYSKHRKEGADIRFETPTITITVRP